MKVSIIAHPNSKKPRVELDLLGVLHIWVSQPPLEGKANMAVIESLAQFLKVKKSAIMLVSGDKSKNKVFEVIR